MSTARDKFSTRVDSELLVAVRELARSNGREIDDLVAEAFTDDWRQLEFPVDDN
jgi:hypothetical protein